MIPRATATIRLWLPMLLALVPTAAAGQNVLSVALVTSLRPGAANAVIPIGLSSTEDLTLLRFDVTLGAGLCSQLVDPGAIRLRRVGRTVAAIEDDQIDCQSGRIRVALLGGIDGTAVVPSGAGAIVEVALGDIRHDTAGTFPLMLQDIVADRGPRPLSIVPSGGQLTIRCAAAADCDDGDACTDDTCQATTGACVHTCRAGCSCGCPASPALGCATSSHGRLDLARGTNPSSHTLRWDLWGGLTLTTADFGKPTATTGYGLCVYDDGLLKVDAEIGPSATRWKPVAQTGYIYRDSAGTAAGVFLAKLSASPTGLSRELVRARGANLPLPSPATTTRFLTASTGVEVQLRGSDGECFATRIGPAQVLRNTSTRFKARF